jgi:hypothetical protein
MVNIARNWRVLTGGVAVGIAGVVGFAGSTAAAEPTVPPSPAPVTVTQTVTVAPAAVAAPPTPLAAPVPQPPTTALAAPTTATTATLPQAPTTALAQPTLITAAPTPALVPASSGTLTEFFQEKGVTLEPQFPNDFRALNITLPMPTGWTRVPDPNVTDAFVVIADRAGGDGLYTSNAQVVVYKLVGDFEPKEAITHGFIDSQSLSNWQSTDASLAEFGGFPSSRIDGTYRQDDMLLNTSRRHVIATGGPDRYLVSLSVTTAANQAVAAASATDAIINGFRVADPAALTTISPPVAHAVPTAPAAPGPVS